MTEVIDSTGVRPGPGHNSHSGSSEANTCGLTDANTIAAILQIHRDNADNLGSGRATRERRDHVLTDAALMLADLLAAGIETKPDECTTLAAALDVTVVWRRDRIATTLARLVCGPGRTMNTYGSLAAAAAHLVPMHPDARRAYLAATGGVTGTAQEARRTGGRSASAPSLEADWVAVRVRMPRVLYDGIRTTPGRVYAAMLRMEQVQGDAPAPLRIIAENP